MHHYKDVAHIERRHSTYIEKSARHSTWRHGSLEFTATLGDRKSIGKVKCTKSMELNFVPPRQATSSFLPQETHQKIDAKWLVFYTQHGAPSPKRCDARVSDPALRTVLLLCYLVPLSSLLFFILCVFISYFR